MFYSTPEAFDILTVYFQNAYIGARQYTLKYPENGMLVKTCLDV